MSRWNVKTSTLFVLSGVVFLMLLIVVLPDVDLPDTAFHQGTAPVLVHARATAAPVVVAVAAIFQFPSPTLKPVSYRDLEDAASHLDPNFRPILLRSIRL